MVRSYFDYASCIWYPIKRKYVHTVESVQRRATILAPEIKHLSYEDRLKRIKLPTMSYRRLREDMVEMYKLTHTIYDFNPEIIILYREINTNRTGLRGHRYTINIMYITSKIKKTTELLSYGIVYLITLLNPKI